MEEVFKEVIIKEMSETASPDKVFIVENLPKRLLVQKVRKQIPNPAAKGMAKAVLMNDPSGEMVEQALDGIRRSETNPIEFTFDLGLNAGKDRLAELDRYVEGHFPRDQRIPKRVYNSTDLSSTRAYPLPVQEMPRVALPALILSVASTPASPRAEEPSVAPEQATTQSEDPKLQAQRDRMAKARAARKA